MDTGVLHAGEGRSVWVAGDLYTIKAAGEDTGGGVALIEALVPPGGGPPPHIHHREDEAFYVVDGRLQFHVDGRDIDAGPGTWVTLARGSLHHFRNAGDTPARMLIVVTPAGLDRYFLRVGRPATGQETEPVAPTPEDIERLIGLAPEFGLEIRVPTPARTTSGADAMDGRDPFLQAAIDEARQGVAEGGIPIGSVLVVDGRIVGRGHNRRVQRGSPILHAEMDALDNAGRLRAADYGRAVLYSTLSPCDMCSGATLLYKIPRVVIGENRTFRGPEEWLRTRGVALEIRDDPECIRLMEEFIRTRPDLWDEDIGVESGVRLGSESPQDTDRPATS